MDGYLNYIIKIDSNSFLEAEELMSTDIPSYSSLLQLGNDDAWNHQNILSTGIQFVDLMTGTYANLAINDMLITTNHQNNLIQETFSHDGTTFNFSLYAF